MWIPMKFIPPKRATLSESPYLYTPENPPPKRRRTRRSKLEWLTESELKEKYLILPLKVAKEKLNVSRNTLLKCLFKLTGLTHWKKNTKHYKLRDLNRPKLESYYYMLTQKETAQLLGVSPRKLKEKMIELGIDSWPTIAKKTKLTRETFSPYLRGTKQQAAEKLKMTKYAVRQIHRHLYHGQHWKRRRYRRKKTSSKILECDNRRKYSLDYILNSEHSDFVK